jgi:soluble lytic murein transglycosylase
MQMKSSALSLILLPALIVCAAPVEQAEPGAPVPTPPGSPTLVGTDNDTRSPGDPSTPEPLPAPISAAPAVPITVGLLPSLGGPNAEQVAQADRALLEKDAARALELLADVRWPPAELLKARAFKSLGQLDAAEDALSRAATDEVLTDLVALERGLVAVLRLDDRGAINALLPLVHHGDSSIAARAALPLAAAASSTDPATLLASAEVVEKALPKPDPDARSYFLEALATAHETLGHADEALGLRLRRFLEEPVSLVTPETPPVGSKPTPLMLITRAEKLLEANRNEKAIEAFSALQDKGLATALKCRKQLGLGLAHRKEHHYATAETYFTQVTNECADDEALVRRAMYLNAKVISIADGLRAVPLIEKFAKRFAGHSMVDDVLFWAGDLYDRRKLWAQAEGYFRRIEELAQKGDQCGDARWRLAWMSYRKGDLKAADKRLSRLLERDGCVVLKYDRARAHYWLGRIAEAQHEPTRAARSYSAAMRAEPLGYYAQLALARELVVAPSQAQDLVKSLQAPKGGETPPLCPGPLALVPAFGRGLELLARGLRSDAAFELAAIEMPSQKVVGTTQAAALGVEPKPVTPLAAEPRVATPARCGEHDPQLLLALLLDRAGVYGAAHWRLRTDFADVLADEPTPETAAIWLAAYPLAYRDLVAAAEEESQVPPLLLQALCREESALDPSAVSWAGAYGLTQLLLASGKGAGKLLSPPVEVHTGEELLEPALSARLGGALLGSLVKRYKGNAGLALAGYNASEATADAWWSRHAGESFDVFEEEITIKETRGYVARVLKTWGIYRWMYANEPPVLPVNEHLPSRE